MDFSGKNVWVTGAGKGIGYATALAFVEAGAKVTGFDQAFTQEQYPFATEVMYSLSTLFHFPFSKSC